MLREKMYQSLKHKHAEKKGDQDKHLLHVRESLHKAIYPLFEAFQSEKYIFSFEFNTPRFSMLSIEDCKIKKMVALLEGNHSNDEFTFKATDRFAWNEQQQQLYIFTINYQMLEATIDTKDLKEENVVLEEYEYLPQNIIDCSFIVTPRGLFAFGGIARCSKKKIQYNLQVYHFNQEKLTWVAVSSLDKPRINPKLTLSSSQ
jgi:hypothetical protein